MKDYLDKIKKYSSTLSICASWNNSGISISKVSKGTADYVYELFCYMTIMHDLSHAYDLKYYKGSGKKENTFPKNPANKIGYPYFEVIDKTTRQTLFQVCAGTKVQSQLVGKERAPDISFQTASASSNSPKSTDILMIYDCKRNKGSKNKDSISIGQHSYFATMVREIGLNIASAIPISFKDLTFLIGNCLITNGKAYETVSSNNQFHNLKEVENFDDKLDLSKIKVIG